MENDKDITIINAYGKTKQKMSKSHKTKYYLIKC